MRLGQYRFAVVVAGIFSIFTVVPAGAQTLADVLRGCQAISDGAARLSCFDAITLPNTEQELAAADTDAGTLLTDTTVAVATVETRDDAFGKDDLARTKEAKKKQNKADKLKSLQSTAVDIATNKRGKYVIILANGQVWRQLTADSDKLRIPRDATGVGVTIKRKSLGAHVLVLENSKRSVRVERIK